MVEYFFIHSVNDYQNKKKSILTAIEQTPKVLGHSGIVTDYFVQGLDRTYSNIVQDDITAFINEIGKFYYDTKTLDVVLGLNGIWFQQYNDGAKHPFHTHPASCFSCVYYVELNEPQMSTQFLDRHGKIFFLNVKEGDIISFPSFIAHRSPVNNGARKTIISFNIQLYQMIEKNSMD